MNINLPSLKGTEKQVAWAEKIRTELLTMIDEEIADELSSPVTVFWREEGLGGEKRDEVLKVAREKIAAQESAAWWIKNKGMNHHNLFYYLIDIYQEG